METGRNGDAVNEPNKGKNHEDKSPSPSAGDGQTPSPEEMEVETHLVERLQRLYAEVANGEVPPRLQALIDAARQKFKKN
jgi:hypothetical protein